MSVKPLDRSRMYQMSMTAASLVWLLLFLYDGSAAITHAKQADIDAYFAAFPGLMASLPVIKAWNIGRNQGAPVLSLHRRVRDHLGGEAGGLRPCARVADRGGGRLLPGRPAAARRAAGRHRGPGSSTVPAGGQRGRAEGEGIGKL